MLQVRKMLQMLEKGISQKTGQKYGIQKTTLFAINAGF